MPTVTIGDVGRVVVPFVLVMGIGAILASLLGRWEGKKKREEEKRRFREMAHREEWRVNGREERW